MMYAKLNNWILVTSKRIQFKVTKDQAYGYHVITMILLNLVLAFFGLFYPLAGFVGDIYTGRFKIIMFGFEAIWIGSFIIVFNIVFTLTRQHSAETITGIASVLLLMIGISCYRSNIIQFGFDQLMDTPSCYLSMFVHWYFWADSLGNFVVEVLTNIHLCFRDQILRLLAYIGAFVCPLIFTLLLMVIYTLQKRGIFNTEPVKSNPYKLILKVLVFAWKNKRPVRPPSAFVYGDRDVRPSRLNLAKERFGGHFQNSDVEDVKTFTRVLRILITLLPLFILEVPVSDGVFLLFTLHAGTSASNIDTNYTLNWIIMGSGTLSYLTQVVFFPIYIWIMFSVLRNRVPKILTRITFAGVLYILAVTSMLIIDLTGHILQAHSKENNTNSVCMLLQKIDPHVIDVEDNTLNMHWSVLILPNLLVGVAPKLLMATALEFISAQTPHTMKGVMVGMLFMLRGISQLLSSAFIFPFSASVWKHKHGVISCRFGYFLLTVAIAIIGLACYIHSACKYRYRVRGEEVFSQCQVEDRGV